MRRKIRKRMRPLGGLVLGATAGSLIGGAMPGTTGAALTSAGGSFASFVGPAATVTGAAMTMDVLGELQPKPRRRRRR